MYLCPEPCHIVSRTPPTPNCYKTKRSRLCVLWPVLGTVAAYPPSPVAMGGSRRPRSDQHFITVRDGELQNAQCALQAWAKDVTVLHSTSTRLQTMLFLGCLLVGCWDLKLFGRVSIVVHKVDSHAKRNQEPGHRHIALSCCIEERRLLQRVHTLNSVWTRFSRRLPSMRQERAMWRWPGS